MLAFIHVFSICVVATMLFVSVDEIEPNPRLALALKFLIVLVSAVAIAGRLMRPLADGLSALMPNRSGPAMDMAPSFSHKICAG
jgi:hypothetical protein